MHNYIIILSSCDCIKQFNVRKQRVMRMSTCPSEKLFRYIIAENSLIKHVDTLSFNLDFGLSKQTFTGDFLEILEYISKVRR